MISYAKLVRCVQVSHQLEALHADRGADHWLEEWALQEAERKFPSLSPAEKLFAAFIASTQQVDESYQDQAGNTDPNEEDHGAHSFNEIDRFIPKVEEFIRPRLSFSESEFKDVVDREVVEGDHVDHDVEWLLCVRRQLDIGKRQVSQDLEADDWAEKHLQRVIEEATEYNFC